MDRDPVLQTNFFLTGILSFQCSLDYQELQNAVPYLANGMILIRRLYAFKSFSLFCGNISFDFAVAGRLGQIFFNKLNKCF